LLEDNRKQLIIITAIWCHLGCLRCSELWNPAKEWFLGLRPWGAACLQLDNAELTSPGQKRSQLSCQRPMTTARHWMEAWGLRRHNHFFVEWSLFRWGNAGVQMIRWNVSRCRRLLILCVCRHFRPSGRCESRGQHWPSWWRDYPHMSPGKTLEPSGFWRCQ